MKDDVEKLLLDNGYDGVKYLTGDSYDSAVLGVTTDNQVVYDYEKMIAWLMEHDWMDRESAAEWIDYNTIRALPYMAPGETIVMYPLVEI